MPRHLRNLLAVFVFLLAVDIAYGVYGALEFPDEVAEVRAILIAVNALAVVIYALIIWVVYAFSERASWAMPCLQTITVVNTIVLAASLLLTLSDASQLSASDGIHAARDVLEIATCCALWLTLRKTSTRNWFAARN